MTWGWTGMSVDSCGRERHTGFTWSIMSHPFTIRVSTGRVPTRTFGTYKRRVVVEIGKLHVIVTLG